MNMIFADFLWIILENKRTFAKGVRDFWNKSLQVYSISLNLGFFLSQSNLHTFKHNFRDTINPMCSSDDGIEDKLFVVALPLPCNTKQRSARWSFCFITIIWVNNSPK